MRAVVELRGIEGIAKREELKAKTRAALSPLGRGLSAWAAASREASPMGKTVEELAESVNRANRFWNNLSRVGLLAGAALMLTALAISVSIVAGAPNSVLGVAGECGAWAGALIGGWAGARAVSVAGARLRDSGLAVAISAALGGLASSVVGNGLGRIGAIIAIGRLVSG